ncbi:MAG: SsrA-binding protein [Parcubacteria group bacterium CG_4_9_14_0_2_um_filter_41_8]|nr:MAG: SsrA-binding protein [Parcubacteria group bacterium CG1_02_41_12]PIP67250.1 MAG: SsrA-binding protein [Parcubacteria group bacterium CG22_combo_CG10-13_8_21_14_all_41_9]PIQ80177.1 MAG: SsrA-binding protein [Parcubacteria group bacterium CG11_big_fil_rev_8_21_14_0_20_41_14]PIR56810.1 MAG: SsrA-binding protein [Parcubacteria group bacterium CG10_big_fil_rev_8_21_14_0_10_41_35]PIZ80342.1 MAG: SsrA-binding protein [Parcubacteria group bacterium CG_4_10_14_0_2_um_filter_41_6]PJC40674.1 MAG:
MNKQNKKDNMLALNKRAKTDWQFLETFEAGIKLTGDEVKSVKKGGANLKASWAVIGQDLVPRLIGCSISRYAHSSQSRENYDPEKSRVLLLNKKEITGLIGKLKQKTLSLIPIKMYSKSGIIKIELALARSKKQFEKREQIKKRDIERDIGRRLKR